MDDAGCTRGADGNHDCGPVQDGFSRLVPESDGRERADTIRHCARCGSMRQHIHILSNETVLRAA